MASGADEYGGVPDFSFVQGPNDSYDDYAVGFAKVYGNANGNTAAQAFLGMTAVGDTYTSDDTQHTDTVQGANYLSQAQGFAFVAAYAASHATSAAVISIASGDTFIGTFSMDTVIGPNQSYHHYLFGFPLVTATTAPGSSNTTGYLQKLSASDFFADETAAHGCRQRLGLYGGIGRDELPQQSDPLCRHRRDHLPQLRIGPRNQKGRTRNQRRNQRRNRRGRNSL